MTVDFIIHSVTFSDTKKKQSLDQIFIKHNHIKKKHNNMSLVSAQPRHVSNTNARPSVHHRRSKSAFTSVLGAERYQLVAKIGQGSFGIVSEFLDTAHGYAPVAIKEVTIREEFEREVSILRALDANQYVVSVLNSFETKTMYCIVMPKADMTLGRFMLRHRLGLDEIANVVMQISYGLHGLHHLGWVHADLKPENMVVSIRAGVPKVQLIDFGSCFRSSSHTTTSTSTASTGPVRLSDLPEEDAYVTTRWYRSPEVVLGIPNAVDKPIDIWALGCIAVEMMTGFVMFPAEDEHELLGMFEAFFGPFNPEFVRTSPHASSIFHDFTTESIRHTTTTVVPEQQQNSHLYGQWFERLERSLIVPWGSISSKEAPYVTLSRLLKCGMYAGDVPDKLFTHQVHLGTYVMSGREESASAVFLMNVIRKMLTVDPHQRLDIDGIILSFF